MQARDLDPRLSRIVDDVVQRAILLVEPERIWLFGSQARGTASRSSDVDIAVQVSEQGRRNWSRFVLETEEESPALTDIDLVDVERCSPALRHEITSTGRIVYEARHATGSR